jgi:Tol biopolymer transport system component/DNA-binding winged helix-turn-helix (wHTH) protein
LPLQTRQIYKFADFTLNATAKVLLAKGEPVKLARKAVETLLVLVEHPDQVLTKEELIEAIWQGRVVDEANLIQNIAVIRRTLGVKPGQPGFIETFPGRGYRLLGPILAEEEALHGPERLVSPAPPTKAIDFELTPAPQLTAPTSPVAKRWLPRIALLFAGLMVAVWALLLLRPKHEPDSIRENFRRTAVARLGGKEFQPAISADGSHVAFVLDKQDGRPTRIWIKSAEHDKPVVIGQPGWAYSSPAWSPDGKSLAYLRFRRDAGELAVATAEGTRERVVTNVFKTRYGLPNHHLDWSPDGRWLAVDDTTSAEQPFSISLVSVATGERRRITTPPDDALGDVDPRFSPGGISISFIRVYHRARQGLFTATITDGKPRQLLREGSQISGQDWTADGKSILFGSNRSGEFRLWRKAVASDNAPVLDWTGVYGDAPIQLALAHRARALVYSVLQEDFNVWRLDLGSRAGSAERWTRIIDSSAQDASPQYSPNGKEICFRSDRTGQEQLWVSDADGSNLQQVTTDTRRPSVGRWSTDGQSIVFNDSREGDIYIAQRNSSGNWKTRAVGAKGTHPIFSKDGKWIYAGRLDRILRIPAAGGPATTLSITKGLSFGPSPDGESIYFVRELTGTTLWKLSTGSGAVSRVMDGLVPYCSSCWAVSTKGVYYLGSTRASVNGQAIYFHDFATASDKLIAEYPEPLLPLGSGPFSLSPDGHYLLCVRVDPSNADVMRIEPYR